MAKTHKLSSSWSVKAGVLSLTIEAREPDASKDAAPIGSFTRSVDLVQIFGSGYSSLNDAGTGALEFGAFTALRNSTGSAETLSEAEAAIDRRLDAWNSGEWGAEREQSATPFTANALIALAVERASNGAQSASEAAEKLNALAEATCAANSKPAFAALEPSDRAKIRKAVVDAIKTSKPLIAAALASLEAERAAAAAAKKAAAAAKAAQGAGDDEGATL